MAFYGQIETAQAVPRKTVCPALQHDCVRLEVAHYVFHHVFENVHERVVVDALNN